MNVNKDLFSQPPIQSPWEGMCFGCSKHNQNGLKLRFWKDENDEKCYSKIKVPEHFCGFNGIVHGGIIATLLDEISAWTIGINKLKMGFTLKSEIQYLQVVPINTELVLIGKIVQDDDPLLTVDSEIILDGRTLARCKSLWKIPDLKLMARLTGVNEEKLKKMLENLKNILK